MTIANSFAAKASVAFVAVAMALMMVAPAQAQTAEELQAQIDALMATIASLQAQAGMSAAPSANAYVFTRSLTIGSEGADVTALQNYLLGAGFSIPAGATGYFGSQTQAAVAAWQTANGVMPAAGYFGPVSQAKYNALMAATPATPSDDDADDDSDDDSSSVTLSGEASMGDTDLKDGDDTDIEEGQEAAPVADFEIEFDNGDAEISRIDLEFSATGEEDPWDTFEEISLWVDGDEVATKAVDDEDDWLSDEKTVRISGLDIIAMEGEEVVITVAVTVQGSVDGLTANWDLDVTNVRFVDADGVTSTEDPDVTAVDFDISEAGADDEVIVKTSSEDPDSTTLQLDDTDKSDWLSVFAFDLDTDDSTNDIELDTIPVSITVNGSTIGNLVNDMRLVIDGEEFDDWSYATGTSASTSVVVLFDIDGDHTIDAGDRVTAELEVEFKALTAEGATIQGSVTSNNSANIAAEGANDVEGEGSATGDVHTLRSSGAILDLVSTTETFKGNTDATTTDDSGTFVLKFDVTAFESDLFVNKTAASSTAAAGTQGVNFIVTDGSGNAVSVGTPTANLSSTANTVGSQYKVAEGETKTFTLTVSLDPNATGFYGVQLYSLNFKSTAGDPTVYQRALPASDFETDALEITN
jgi:peptidoglycan hydrolase-like protein with peptidoglycan-binding domain